MNELKVFNYEDNEMRTVMIDDEPWWVLKDVCGVLGLTNSRMVAERLDEDEKGVSQIDTIGGRQEVVTINEPGLYNVILRSDKPEAKKFRRWVVHEALPQIRKTGGYGKAPKLTADQAIEALHALGKVKRHTAPYAEAVLRSAGIELEAQSPSVSAHTGNAEINAKTNSKISSVQGFIETTEQDDGVNCWHMASTAVVYGWYREYASNPVSDKAFWKIFFNLRPDVIKTRSRSCDGNRQRLTMNIYAKLLDGGTVGNKRFVGGGV